MNIDDLLQAMQKLKAPPTQSGLTYFPPKFVGETYGEWCQRTGCEYPEPMHSEAKAAWPDTEETEDG